MPATLTKEAAKEAFVAEIARGLKVDSAIAAVGRTRKTYEAWRNTDKAFAAEVDRVREIRANATFAGVSEMGVTERGEKIGFAEFREKYLDRKTYVHQQQWVDVLEGREPVHIEGTEYRSRNPKRIVVNTPPGHAKSSTITVDYATYKVCTNPNIRILIISKRVEQARKFLTQIKTRLTSTVFTRLQAAYAPEGGFRPAKGEGTFSANVIYVAGRTNDEKDPTIEVAGLGSAIYGGRYDLIVLDDVVDLENANQFENQIDWIASIVESRLKNGVLLVVGTRLKPLDLYSELLRDERYINGKSPYTYLRQPIVLQFAEDPKDWVTLWPKSTTPYDESDWESEPDENGEYVVFDGEEAAKIRSTKSPAVWSMVYMQMTMNGDAAFKPLAVMGSMDRRRKPGPLTAGAWGHPRTGKDGMWTIGSMDPAMTGDTFVIVGSVDRVQKKRWVEQAWVKTSPSPQWFRDIIKHVTEVYDVNEWVIEKNAFQLFLTEDEGLKAWLANKGIRITPHYSGHNKADPDFGVASLEPLFGSIRRINEGAGREVFNGDNLIELPDCDQSQGLRALVDQLYMWEPGRKPKDLKMDGPMALWFLELRARNIIKTVNHDGEEDQQEFVTNRFMLRKASSMQRQRPVGLFSRGR